MAWAQGKIAVDEQTFVWQAHDGGFQGAYWRLQQSVNLAQETLLATWPFSFDKSLNGWYEVWAYWPAHTRVAPLMRYRVFVNEQEVAPLLGGGEKRAAGFPEGRWIGDAGQWVSLGVYEITDASSLKVELWSEGFLPACLPVDTVLVAQMPPLPDIPVVRQAFAGDKIFFWADERTSAQLFPNEEVWLSVEPDWNNWEGSHLLPLKDGVYGRAQFVFPQVVPRGEYELCTWIPGDTEHAARMVYSIYLDDMPAWKPEWQFYVLGRPQPLNDYQTIIDPEEGFWNRQCLGRLYLQQDRSVEVWISPAGTPQEGDLIADVVLLITKFR